MIDWLYSNALGAAALAVVAAVLIWTFRPSPAVRHALWLVVLVKLVSPTGLWVSVPLPVEVAADDESGVVAAVAPCPPADPEPEPQPSAEERFTVVLEQVEWAGVSDPAEAAAIRMECKECAVAAAEPAPVTAAVAPAAAPTAPFDYRPVLIAAWVLGAGYFGWRSVRESLKFSRFARRSVPAPDYLRAEVAAVARKLGVRAPAVRVLAGLSSPLMWCLGRPVLLWPAGLDARLKGDGRLAVIAHELAHLRRRDHWVRRLEMAAVVLHWWNPVFWVARKRLRADAELACDAWAAGQADRRAYAEALLEVCSFNHRRRPAPAVGVSGEGRRAMQERLAMIMRDRVPCRLAFGAKLVVALMVVAAVPAWTLGQAKATKTEKAEAAGDPDVQKIEAQMKALAEKLAAVRAAKAAEEAAKQAAAAEKQAQAGKVKDVLIEKVAGQNVRVLRAGQDGVKVIGADGKELKDVRVIIVEKPATGAAGKATKTAPAEAPMKFELQLATPEGKPGTTTTAPKVEWRLATPGQGTTKVAPGADLWTAPKVEGQATVALTRATYKLGKGQAEALAGLLGNVKASVLEVKVDGDTLTLTTTPDVQATVGQIVRLLTGQGAGNAIYRFAPMGQGVPGAPPVLAVPPTPPAPPAAVTPAAPRAPRAPAAPAKPSTAEKPAIEVHVVPATKPGEKEVRVEVLRDNVKNLEKNLEKLKEARGVQVEALKDLEKLKETKELRIDVLKDLKDLEKLKDLKELKELKDLKDLKIELKLDELKDLKIDTAELKARIEKAIEAATKAGEKKPAGPAK